VRNRIVATLVIVLSIAGASRAQDVTRGVQLGLHGGFTTWDLGDIVGNEFEKESGPHFGGSFGWGMSDWLGIFTRLDRTTISPEGLVGYSVQHWDIGIQTISLIFGQTVRPYAEVSGAIRSVKLDISEFEVKGSGVGLGLGAGVYVFVVEKIAVTAGGTYSFGNLDEVSFGGVSVETVLATSVRLFAGITWFP